MSKDINISGSANGMEVYGAKTVSADTYKGDSRFNEKFVSIKFCEGIPNSFPGVETVEKGFLDQMPHLKMLKIADTVKYIGVTEKLNNIMHQNDVLVIGTFGTYAEEFARKYKLRFLPANIEIARVGDYYTKYGIDIITIVVNYSGTVFINQDERCPGSSAGSTGGGSIDIDLEWDFFKDPDAQRKIADKCWGNCYSQIMESKPLANFIEKAREYYKKENHNRLIINF